MKKKIWYDLTNVPHVNFLHPVYQHYKSEYDSIFTLRDFAETKGLFGKTFGFNPMIIGRHQGGSKVKKVLGSVKRVIDLNRAVGDFSVKVSIGGDASGVVAKLRGKLSITFDDNEKAPNWRYSRFSDLAFWPDVIDPNVLKKQGFKPHKTFRYMGYKEDMYLADYKPDTNFLSQLPFNEYVIVRPENIQANYVNGADKSIVPELLIGLSKAGYNILFLPRYEHDKDYAKGVDGIYIPSEPLNGLDACFYSTAVLTGAGTLAREAACLGIPAFSFYAGKELLTVDSSMIEKGWMYFSRIPEDLLNNLKSIEKRKVNLQRSKTVKNQILQRMDQFFTERL